MGEDLGDLSFHDSDDVLFVELQSSCFMNSSRIWFSMSMANGDSIAPSETDIVTSLIAEISTIPITLGPEMVKSLSDFHSLSIP